MLDNSTGVRYRQFLWCFVRSLKILTFTSGVLWSLYQDFVRLSHKKNLEPDSIITILLKPVRQKSFIFKYLTLKVLLNSIVNFRESIIDLNIFQNRLISTQEEITDLVRKNEKKPFPIVCRVIWTNRDDKCHILSVIFIFWLPLRIVLDTNKSKFTVRLISFPKAIFRLSYVLSFSFSFQFRVSW